MPAGLSVWPSAAGAFAPVAAPKLRRADLGGPAALTTRRVARQDPGLLPWNQPRLYGAYARARRHRLPIPRVIDVACYCATYTRP